MKTVTIEIPENLYSGLMDLFFAAIRKSDVSEKNPLLYAWIQTTIHEAFKNEDIVIIDGKIISKEDLKK
jgi:hypothetical protein